MFDEVLGTTPDAFDEVLRVHPDTSNEAKGTPPVLHQLPILLMKQRGLPWYFIEITVGAIGGAP